MGKSKDCLWQSTIARAVSFSGTGVHTGRPARVTLNPAEAGTGIRFRRIDLSNGTRSTVVRADWRNVRSTQLCTVLGNEDVITVMMVEHLLAALSGLGIDNVDVHLNGPEVPILDGSAKSYVEAILDVGIARLAEHRKYVRVLRPVRVQIGDTIAEFVPDHDCDFGSTIETKIDFLHPLIGRQSFTFEVGGDAFATQIAAARTFGFYAQAQKLRSQGYGLGASLDNTVVLDATRILNVGGLRFADEFVRHKALDACGDIALAGAPILGRFRSSRGGHHLNHAALSCLMSQPECWELAEWGDHETTTIGGNDQQLVVEDLQIAV
ncbi:MAG: UDP-3-O-acyl-N-acetylglucosamine deacetylase [Hyphomicrobiales bacterium]